MDIQVSPINASSKASEPTPAVAARSGSLSGRSISPLTACLIGAIVFAALVPGASAQYAHNAPDTTELTCRDVTNCYPGLFEDYCITDRICEYVTCGFRQICDGITFFGNQICHDEYICFT